MSNDTYPTRPQTLAPESAMVIQPKPGFLDKTTEDIRVNNSKLEAILHRLDEDLNRILGAVPPVPPPTDGEAEPNTAINKVRDSLHTQARLINDIDKIASRLSEL